MAWNEPGGGDKDPWGSRGDQGPPDLDEAFKKLQSQLTGIFGGGGRGGGGRGFNSSLVGLALVVVAVGYSLFGLYQIDQGERGVVFRFGAVQETSKLPGLHWNPPIIDVVQKVNVTQMQSHKHQALMLTEDENIVDVSLTVQYVVNDPVAWVVMVRDPRSSLGNATESALRHVVGGTIMDRVITDGRADIQTEVEQRLQSYLDRYGTGIQVSKVNIDESAPPNQVREAFNDVQRAKEDEQRVINEANAFAEQIIPEARGGAQKLIEEASGYREQVIARAEGETQRFEKLLAEYLLAKEVTRNRLYIDALESVLSNSSKVMVDVDGGNNLMYLPLDKLTQQAAASAGSPESVRSIADAVMRELNNRAGSGRVRDTR
ncbi:MAG: FtsH protease activity modulator HflK [Pseudomonadales bacterium]|jgi:membrane protease subunit HflK|nr:FtsH protease activity modulator HflK [Pseudomonadales bacterium]MDP6469563.1 FtsH protease activity modulator HflK [Pseudomonadales bacterium]MDP6827404.1 FtsH protease activity modulator HflK [Pseudomonadales bacterium]MDP6971227.1 FtsH protease activity modulator HflK [Pseudomonadales bacterium]